MLFQNFYFIEIVYVFVVIFIDNRCVRGDNQTKTKLPETTLEPAKKIIKESTLVKRLNVIQAVSQSPSNAERTRTVTSPSAKLGKASFRINTICDKNQTEICKILLTIWNPDRCKCEQIKKVNNQEVTVGSRRGNFALSPRILPPLPTKNITSASKEIKSDEISLRSPFLPRLG